MGCVHSVNVRQFECVGSPQSPRYQHLKRELSFGEKAVLQGEGFHDKRDLVVNRESRQVRDHRTHRRG